MIKRLKNLRLENLRSGCAAWLRERIDLRPVIALAGKKTVPIHRLSCIYLLGGAALFLFGLQVASGCLLMLYYRPTEEAAYRSVERIMTEVPYGWLVRSIHVWTAHLFIAVVFLHFLTVLFTKAYRKPREMTWLSGVMMLLLALGFGFSGYLLPWNELSYYATRVGTEIPGSLPVVGPAIVHLLRGGANVSGDTIGRFFAAHVTILPLVAAAVLSIHLLLIQAQGMSLPLGMKKEAVRIERPFFTEFALVDACVWLLLLGTIVTLAVLLPAEIGARADPLKPAPAGIKPEWYFLFMFKTLKHVPEIVGVALFALGGLFFFVVPLLDRNASRERKSPLFTALFTAALVYVIVFQIWAISEPGVEHPPEKLAAETYHLANAVVWLVLLWSVIGFLIYYLVRLLRENARVRELYRRQSPAAPKS